MTQVISKESFVDIPPRHRPGIDDLPGELPLIARAVEEHLPGQGVQVALILAQKYPGTPIHLHNVKRIINSYTHALMREEYDRGGVTVKEVARKYGVSMTKAKEILASTGE